MSKMVPCTNIVVWWCLFTSQRLSGSLLWVCDQYVWLTSTDKSLNNWQLNICFSNLHTCFIYAECTSNGTNVFWLESLSASIQATWQNYSFCLFRWHFSFWVWICSHLVSLWCRVVTATWNGAEAWPQLSALVRRCRTETRRREGVQPFHSYPHCPSDCKSHFCNCVSLIWYI